MPKKKDVTIPKESANQLFNRLLKENNLTLVQTPVQPLQKSIKFISDGSVIINQPEQPTFNAEFIKK